MKRPHFYLHFQLLLAFLFLLCACEGPVSKAQVEKWKVEIVAVEKAFNDMAQEEGLTKAFEFYAADDGVIRRKKEVIQGKKAIRAYYEKDAQPDETLSWVPTFVDVSSAGDMAYTYGNYVFSYPDTLGNIKKNTGIFHTVWKRQEDGAWRFVWD